MRVKSGKRVRRTSSQWREIITRFDSSDLSIDAFCAQESVSTSSFQRWRARLAPQMNSFIELDVPAPTPSPSAWTVELALPGDIVLRVQG